MVPAPRPRARTTKLETPPAAGKREPSAANATASGTERATSAATATRAAGPAYAAALAEQFPAVHVDPHVLYEVDGQVATSAGTAAESTSAWNSCAGTTGPRSLPRWPGGSSCPRTGRAAKPSTSPPRCRRSPTRRWRPCWTGRGPAWTSSSPWGCSLVRSARPPARSPRRFTAELGLPPLQWLTAERIRRARQLLEDTGLSIEQVAQQCGLGTAANLRLHFIRQTGTTPTAYRAAFTRWTAVRAGEHR